MCTQRAKLRERESLLEKTFPLCTGSDKESAPREAEPCWESLLSGEEKTARARSSPGADLGFECAEIKLQNVVVVIFLFLEHLRRFYLIMDRKESSIQIVTDQDFFMSFSASFYSEF